MNKKLALLHNMWVCDGCKKVYPDMESFGQCDSLDEHQICVACIEKAKLTYKDMDDGYYPIKKCPVCKRQKNKNK